MISIQEHGFFEKLDVEITDLPLTIDEAEPDTLLGIYQCWNNVNRKLQAKANYFVGLCWLNSSHADYILVRPKIEIDYLKIFSVCLSDPIVSKHFDNAYKIYFNEPLIEIDATKVSFDITLLLIKHFLEILKRISQKGIKKRYVNTAANLTGKIKGKINVNRTIRKNLSSSRQDRVCCEFQIFTTNCIENQLLKTALQQCTRYLCCQERQTELISLLKYNQRVFESVSEIAVNYSEFKKVKHSTFYSEYKQALLLAEMIFKRLGFSPNQSATKTKVPPFYINMPELFERYVEVFLRINYPDLLVGRDKPYISQTSSTWGLRPDFLIKSGNMIIDAKYKNWHGKESDADFKSDFQQLSLYSRTKGILKAIDCYENDSEARLIFIYPNVKSDKSIDLKSIKEEQNFSGIYKVGISLPLVF